MASTLVTAILSSGAAGETAPSVDSRAQVPQARVTAPEKCPSARKGLAFYRGRYYEHRAKMGAPTAEARGTVGRCSHVRDALHIWKYRAFVARRTAEYHVTLRTLRDFPVRAGNRAWHRAVKEAQRAYPGTEGWLMSCSASEGGHGRWVPNSQGSGVGGWLQFYPSTFYGFYERASSDVRKRGYRVPRSASSWYSPLGQALAGGWAITNGMRHHWVGSGC